VQEDEAIQEFDEIYQKYHYDIYRFLMKLTIYNSYLAEELTQETFYRVYLGIGGFKGKCHIKTWICQIAKNSYYLYLRKNKKTENLNVLSSVFEKVEVCQKSHISSTEETYENKEMINIMIKIIDSFKEVNQNVMIYRIFFNMSYAEISKLLGISEASAKVIYHRGKIMMQNKLREEYGYEI
jgi:RNA polymerase sigma-70 factor (ECF subfamily)